MVPGFTGGTLDRAEPVRTNPEAYRAALSDWRGRLLVLDGLEPRVDEAGGLEWTSIAEAPEGAELVLLGMADGRPHFAALVPGVRATRSARLMAALASLASGEAATYAGARSLLDWHARHGFCANCGHGTALYRAGWGRQCPNCAAEHFPRVDPVVIMIAEHEGRALLGRQPSFPPGRYSALAGFLEVGESIEEAVAREIHEEAGVTVGEVRYIASQPWPFPSQLMIACVARADSDVLTLDTEELEDAIWVSRDEVCAVLAGEPGRFLPPPPIAIAHTLLTAWAGE